MMKTTAVRGCARIQIAIACALASVTATGADYPIRSIRVIVPFVAGGGTDLLARLISPRLTELLAQQIIVDNRGGAGSIVGTELVARAPADGYTLGIFDTAFAINPALQEKLPFDSRRDFVFPSIIATSPTLLVAGAGLKVRTIQELITFAKASPGKIRSASAGVGSSSHLTGEMLKMAAGIDMTHVPYKGAGQAIIDVVGGHADVTFVVPGTVRQHLQSGALVALAINRPSANLPAVPTFASVGLPSVDPGNFRFMAAPAALPPPILNKLIATLRTVMDTPELQTRLKDNDYDPTFLPHPESRAFVEKELSKWQKAVKSAGAKAN
jgi:tripartite-type tricarboxylate transporter receptor subunit TctC